MSEQRPPTPARADAPVKKARSFLFWAFLISLGLHFVLLPLLHLHAQSNEKDKVEKVVISKKIKVVVPTPPPTPTPPPPTPPPKQTPPPVKQTNPPPQPKLKLNVPKTTSHTGPSTEHRYEAPAKGTEDAVPNGTEASGKPEPASTAPAATPAPTPAPPTPTPKPQCANPNADATIKGTAADLDYPEIAKQQGLTGTTQVLVTLDASGSVVSATVHKSAGSAALDQAAITAAKATAYVPEIVNCVKTAGSYIFRADFSGQ